MNVPNLFIVGAPKCGTTSLHYYLNQHPDIFMSEPKEPNFFNIDLKRKNRISSKDYFQLFANKDEKYLGEATPLYLMSKEAATQIKEISPSAHIILSIRRPAELIFSAYLQNRYNVIEQEEDFLKAINAEEERAKTLKETLTGEPVERLIYSNFVQYTNQIERYISTFGRNRIHVILFDDLKRNTPEEVEKIFSFLDLPTDVAINYSRQNKAKTVKNEKLAKLLYSPSGIIKTIGTFIPSSIKRTLYTLIQKINTSDKQALKLDPVIDKMLTEKYESEIANLETLLKRDLSIWKSVDNR